MSKSPIRVIEHEMDEELAIKLLGWRWMAFDGVPVKGTPGYPESQTVRALLPPSMQKGRQVANGNEPLAYSYCSSYGHWKLPRFTILVEKAHE